MVVIEEYLDLTPLFDREPANWFWIGYEEHRTRSFGMSCGVHAVYDDANDPYPDRDRYCTRTKGHVGPHVSGARRFSSIPAIAWYPGEPPCVIRKPSPYA